MRAKGLVVRCAWCGLWVNLSSARSGAVGLRSHGSIVRCDGVCLMKERGLREGGLDLSLCG